ncbi:MAG: phage integrase N-terminal SAM-like domain-containing protein [Bryobacteraceae bacterium]
MLEELQRRNYSQSTVRAYIRAVHELAAYFRRPPDRLGPEHLRQFQVHLFRERKLDPRTVMQQVRCMARHSTATGFALQRLDAFFANDPNHHQCDHRIGPPWPKFVHVPSKPPPEKPAHLFRSTNPLCWGVGNPAISGLQVDNVTLLSKTGQTRSAIF